MDDKFLKWLKEENQKLWAATMKAKLDSMQLHPRKHDPAIEMTLMLHRKDLAN